MPGAGTSLAPQPPSLYLLLYSRSWWRQWSTPPPSLPCSVPHTNTAHTFSPLSPNQNYSCLNPYHTTDPKPPPFLLPLEGRKTHWAQRDVSDVSDVSDARGAARAVAPFGPRLFMLREKV